MRRSRRRRAHAPHVNSTGATSRAPAASPSHHVHHNDPYAVHGCTPPAHRLATPIVALIVVLASAPNTTRPRACGSLSSDERRPVYRRIRYAPTIASSVLPAATQTAIAGVSCAVTLARK